ncbi:Uma2 family endonuclease [Parasphingorhabdus pacifica]
MTWPDHLLSLTEFEQLPEDNSRRYELQEGVLHVTPKAAIMHQRAVGALVQSLNSQLPAEWEAVPDVEVVLVQTWPPTVRVPDVVVASTSLIDQNPNRLHAQDVVLAIEVVSPGSGQNDRVIKRHEYAKAGISAYWVVELADQVTMTAAHVSDGVYKTLFEGTGRFLTGEPFELDLDLDGLVRRPADRRA